MTFKTYRINIGGIELNENILKNLREISQGKYLYQNKMHMIESEYNIDEKY